MLCFPEISISAHASLGPEFWVHTSPGPENGDGQVGCLPGRGPGPGLPLSHSATVSWCLRGSEKFTLPTVRSAPGGWEGGRAF